VGGGARPSTRLRDEHRLRPSLILRDAVVEELEAIVAIERVCFSDPWSVASFRQLLGATTAHFRVATRDEVVVGYAVATLIGEEAELANIAVTPEARRLGVGARLLDDLLAITDHPLGATVYLEVRASNAPAQLLYRSRGFESVGVRKGYYARPEEDAVVMRRTPGRSPSRA